MAEIASPVATGRALLPTMPRRRELLFGTALVAGGVSMVIIVLIGNYLATRDAATGWLANNQIPLTQPNMQLITLGMSAITMQWAVWCVMKNDRYHAYMALGITILLGLAFVNQSTFLYKMTAVTIDQPEGPLFYAVTGSHLAMVVAGLLFMILMTFRTLGGQNTSRQPDGISAAAIFWYAGIALYVVIWFAVYVQK